MNKQRKARTRNTGNGTIVKYGIFKIVYRELVPVRA